MATLKAADGCSLYYERSWGQDRRWFLIPGLGGDGRFWGGVVAALKDRFDFVVVDHRGAGRSDRPASPYSIGGIAYDARWPCWTGRGSRPPIVGSAIRPAEPSA